MEIIRTAAECSRFRTCCFSSAALRIIRYSFVDRRLFQKLTALNLPNHTMNHSVFPVRRFLYGLQCLFPPGLPDGPLSSGRGHREPAPVCCWRRPLRSSKEGSRLPAPEFRNVRVNESSGFCKMGVVSLTCFLYPLLPYS